MKKTGSCFLLLFVLFATNLFAGSQDVKYTWTPSPDPDVTEVRALKSLLPDSFDPLVYDGIIPVGTNTYTFLSVAAGTWYFAFVTWDGTEFSVPCDIQTEVITNPPSCISNVSRIP